MASEKSVFSAGRNLFLFRFWLANWRNANLDQVVSWQRHGGRVFKIKNFGQRLPFANFQENNFTTQGTAVAVSAPGKNLEAHSFGRIAFPAQACLETTHWQRFQNNAPVHKNARKRHAQVFGRNLAQPGIDCDHCRKARPVAQAPGLFEHGQYKFLARHILGVKGVSRA